MIGRLICRLTGTHEWWVHQYPPRRVEECTRCHAIREASYDRVPAPR